MGYTPQLPGGVWVGCDDRFIRNEGNGVSVAPPPDLSGEAFKSVWRQKLGIDREAVFAKPAEMESDINSADLEQLIDNTPPGGQGDDIGAGTEEDYNINREYIPPESKVPVDEDQKPVKRDTISTVKPEEKSIGDPVEDPKRRKGSCKSSSAGETAINRFGMIDSRARFRRAFHWQKLSTGWRFLAGSPQNLTFAAIFKSKNRQHGGSF